MSEESEVIGELNPSCYITLVVISESPVGGSRAGINLCAAYDLVHLVAHDTFFVFGLVVKSSSKQQMTHVRMWVKHVVCI